MVEMAVYVAFSASPLGLCGALMNFACNSQPLEQGDYQAWLDGLPPSLADSATADALRSICDLDLSELQGIEPPRKGRLDGLDLFTVSEV